MSKNNDSQHFVALLQECGYKLKEIETTIGLIPAASLKFAIVRELTEGDKAHLDRTLQRWAAEDGSPSARIQRRIIYTILDINDLGKYSVDELKVTLLPLPKATFSLGPAEGGLSAETDILLRAIKGQARRGRATPGESLTD